MDTIGNKSAAAQTAGIKVAVPNMALKVIDRAIQVHGAAGVTQFFPLAHMYTHMRTLRIADGPDKVHPPLPWKQRAHQAHPDGDPGPPEWAAPSRRRLCRASPQRFASQHHVTHGVTHARSCTVAPARTTGDLPSRYRGSQRAIRAAWAGGTRRPTRARRGGRACLPATR
ncbi:MAG: acyl-CoA dehydrogenase family protein [Acidimicrobiales bacterium]